METKPTAFPSLDEWVNESQVSAATTIYNPTAPNKMAPTAQPEGEDIDMEVSPKIKQTSMSETSAVICQCTHIEAESKVDLDYTEIDKSLCEDEFPPPPPDFSDFSTEETSGQVFSFEFIANERMDQNISNPVHDPDICQKWRNCFLIVDSEDTTHTTYTPDGGMEKISTNHTVRECTNSECIVPSLPFADESDEDAEADFKNFNLDKSDVSESDVNIPALDDLEQQTEQLPQYEEPPMRDSQASTVSTSSNDHEFIFAHESNKDEEALQRELSLQYEVPLVSNNQSSQEYSGDVGENEDTFEAFPDELSEMNSTVFPPPLENDNKDEETYVDILHKSNFESNTSTSCLSTSLAEDVSQQQGELFPQHEVPPVSNIHYGPEHCSDVVSIEAGENKNTIESTALLFELSETILSPQFTPFANKDNIAEVNTLTMYNLHFKSSNVSEFRASTSAVETESEQHGELSLQCELDHVSDLQSSPQYNSEVFKAGIEESENTVKPTALPDVLEDSYNNTLHNSDYVCVVSKSTALAPPVVEVSEQQEVLSLPYVLPPLDVNQETTQQVLSQASPPLSLVSIEPANHTAPSEGTGVVIGECRAGHGAVKGESRLISADERQLIESRTVGPITDILKSVQEPKEKPRHVSCQLRTMESDSCDESDSGVSADFSPGSTLESSSCSASVHKETPIEREIRKAIEREHSLRRSRGLPNLPTSPEYVEIPLRKASPYQLLPLDKSEKCQGKDRQFAGKKMQKDIYEEAQREQDLVKLGKIPGFYDKGTIRQLKERKDLFEAFQKPSDSCSVKSNAISSSNYISFSENDSLCHKLKGTGSDTRNELKLKNPKIFPEEKSCHIIIIENNINLPTVQPNTNIGEITVVDSSTVKTCNIQNEKDLYSKTPKENPFFKLRSSTSVVKVEQDIREAQERERELHRQRINLYGTRVERGGGGPAGTEEHSSPLSSLKALPVQDLPNSSQSGVATNTTTSAARHSSGRFGVWPPAPAEKNHQTEVQHCPRMPRQKNPLVQRWESGLINAQED